MNLSTDKYDAAVSIKLKQLAAGVSKREVETQQTVVAHVNWLGSDLTRVFLLYSLSPYVQSMLLFLFSFGGRPQDAFDVQVEGLRTKL